MPETINIDLELSALEAMTPKQLRRRYREVWGEETRSGNKRFMIKRIAWKLQALAEGEELREDVQAILKEYGGLKHNELLDRVYEEFPAYAKKSRRKKAAKKVSKKSSRGRAKK